MTSEEQLDEIKRLIGWPTIQKLRTGSLFGERFPDGTSELLLRDKAEADAMCGNARKSNPGHIPEIARAMKQLKARLPKVPDHLSGMLNLAAAKEDEAGIGRDPSAPKPGRNALALGLRLKGWTIGRVAGGFRQERPAAVQETRMGTDPKAAEGARPDRR